MRGKKGPDKCEVEGCENKHFAHNLCNKHHKRHTRQMSLENEDLGLKENACSVEGCCRLGQHKGLCLKHYMRQYRYGDTKLRGRVVKHKMEDLREPERMELEDLDLTWGQHER